ncbi:Gfo/Idh/MocA family oxidoreductase [Deferribacter autotrophicus]|uniref:Gfo/Idh/MocA family oxidoreductase n=1 Tax=Deferribacter autotrophicus TaxID=500465 RepID=A0A5A8F7A0_9BACT|nr:Gfo/Idh/MocA family oxidoreductase [Deferribacter autotrophicus]KAA0257736.1 Gfo/Idh/MocA family oxidoreductase [Deferribacter autotrophicus]
MIKMGLIGLGRMGKYHLNLYDEIPEIKLMGICDINEEEVNKLSKQTGVRGYTNYEEMLDLVDAVTVAVPTRLHYEVAKKCLLSGKHVLVEKPITTDLEEAKELFKIAEEKNLVLNIGHVERFNGAVMELKKIVRDPFLIESRRVGPYAERMKNDSIILDLMIHDIDIILNILDDEVVDIQAQGSRVYSNLTDLASVNLKFKKGTVVNIIVSRVNQKKDRTMSIAQKDAYIYLDYTNQDINIYRQGQSQHIFGDKELTYKNEYILERMFVYKDNPLKLEIKHFIDCIDNRSCRMVSVEHELKSLEIALKIDEILHKEGK